MTAQYEIFDHDDFDYDKNSCILSNQVGFKQEPININSKDNNDNNYYRVLVEKGEVIQPFLQSYLYTVIDKVYTTFDNVIIKIIPHNHFAKLVFKLQYKNKNQ